MVMPGFCDDHLSFMVIMLDVRINKDLKQSLKRIN